MFKTRLFILLLVLCGTQQVHAQKTSFLDSVFVDTLLIEDLVELRKVMFESHPHPGGYNDSILLNKAFDNAIEEVVGGKSYVEFVAIVQEILQVQNDSHTTVDIAAVREQILRSKEPVMPVQFSYNGTDLWVKKDFAGILPKGFLIESINGMKPSELYDLAYCYSFTEGNALESRTQVETAMLSTVLLLEDKLTTENEIIGIAPGSSESSTVSYKLLDKKEIQEISKKNKKSNSEKFEELFHIKYYPNDSLAVLTISTFVPYYFQRSEKFLRRVFKNLRKEGYRHLVVDVRDNTGGSSARVEHLCSYLFEEGHNAPSNIIIKQSELAKKRSRRTLGGFKKLIFKLSKDENAIAFIEAATLPDGATDTLFFKEPVVQNEKYVFTGNCYVFMNGLTASAGVDFASAIRQRNRGVLIGQPCMGSGHGTWGNPTDYKLKNSDIPLHIATIRYNSDDTFNMTPMPMEPDYVIIDQPKRSEGDSDPFLEFMLELIRKKTGE